jgi:hypothetical protein
MSDAPSAGFFPLVYDAVRRLRGVGGRGVEGPGRLGLASGGRGPSREGQGRWPPRGPQVTLTRTAGQPGVVVQNGGNRSGRDSAASSDGRPILVPISMLSNRTTASAQTDVLRELTDLPKDVESYGNVFPTDFMRGHLMRIEAASGESV